MSCKIKCSLVFHNSKGNSINFHKTRQIVIISLVQKSLRPAKVGAYMFCPSLGKEVSSQ